MTRVTVLFQHPDWETSEAVATLNVSVVSYFFSLSLSHGELSHNEFCFKAVMVS